MDVDKRVGESAHTATTMHALAVIYLALTMLSTLHCNAPDSSLGWRVAARLISAPHILSRRRSLMLRLIGTMLPDT